MTKIKTLGIIVVFFLAGLIMHFFSKKEKRNESGIDCRKCKYKMKWMLHSIPHLYGRIYTCPQCHTETGD